MTSVCERCIYAHAAKNDKTTQLTLANSYTLLD